MPKRWAKKRAKPCRSRAKGRPHPNGIGATSTELGRGAAKAVAQIRPKPGRGRKNVACIRRICAGLVPERRSADVAAARAAKPGGLGRSLLRMPSTSMSTASEGTEKARMAHSISRLLSTSAEAFRTTACAPSLWVAQIWSKSVLRPLRAVASMCSASPFLPIRRHSHAAHMPN